MKEEREKHTVKRDTDCSASFFSHNGTSTGISRIDLRRVIHYILYASVNRAVPFHRVILSKLFIRFLDLLMKNRSCL